jgi:uncharacterized membrane protein YfcA
VDYPQLILLAGVGVMAGWLNVMAGGGSLLTVPVMLFMDIPAPVANGTNRIGILMQNVSAVTAFFRKGFSDFRLSLSLSAAASVGAVGGAMLGVELDGVWFDRLLAAVIVGVMMLMATGKKSSGAPPAGGGGAPQRLLLGHLCMVGAGFWGGLIQIGVGFILMPILHRVMGLDLVRVNMHKVFVVLVYTLIALTVFAANVQILWVAGMALALGMMIGGWLGAHTTVVHGEVWIRRVLFAALSVIIVKLLWPGA